MEMSRTEVKRCKIIDKDVRIRVKTYKIEDGNSNSNVEHNIGETCLHYKKSVPAECTSSGCKFTGISNVNPF